MRTRKHALVSQIVDRVTTAWWIWPPLGQSVVQGEDRHQTDLPIVHVNDFRCPRKVTRQVYNGFRKKDVPLSIVGIVDAAFVINPRPIGERGLIHEMRRNVL